MGSGAGRSLVQPSRRPVGSAGRDDGRTAGSALHEGAAETASQVLGVHDQALDVGRPVGQPTECQGATTCSSANATNHPSPAAISQVPPR